MSKTTGKKKQMPLKNRKAAAGKQNASRQLSSVSKEIVGLSLMGTGLLVLIGVFTEKSGLFGSILRQLFVGLFGVGGYIIPISVIVIGVFYIQGDFKKVIRSSIFIGSFTLLLMVFFHTLRYGEDMSISLLSTGYIEEAHWSNGGYIGAALAYLFLKLLGIYGTYIVLGVLTSIWVLTLTDFPIFSWLYKQGENWAKEEGAKRIQARKQKQLVREEKRKQQLERPIEEAPILLDGYEEDYEEEAAAGYEVPDVTYQPAEEEVPVITALPPKVYEPEPTVLASEKSKPAVGTKSFSESDSIKEIMPQAENRAPYEFPPITLLNKVQAVQNKEASRKSLSNARKLEETLASFGVEAKVTQISRGPAVTRYELQPKQGVKVSKIVNLSDDIALNLAAPSIRIEAPIPGKAAVGIEVANEASEVVYLRDVIDSDRFLAFPSKLAFALGKDIAGKPVIADIGKMPHLLIAGATGSGKSVCINTLITSIIYKARPDEVKLIMIDPKVVELSVYNGIPHLLIPVVTDPKKAAGALFWAVNEMTRRYNLFAENNVRDMKGYNEKQEEDSAKLPQMVIIIDELADLMMTGAKEVEDAICRLAQMARAAGIHLVIATQRPSVDVITGVIKANIPSRLAFAVSSGTDSRTILDSTGAEKLLGKGDMLFLPMGESKPTRIQGAFVSDKEVESIVAAVKTDQVNYETSVIESLDQTSAPAETASGSDEDELIEKAVEFAAGKEKLSISMLQRYFRIGFNRAARLMEALEARGVVGPDEGSKPRKVLL